MGEGFRGNKEEEPGTQRGDIGVYPGSIWRLWDIFLYWNHFNLKPHSIMLKPFFVWQNKVLKRIDPGKVMILSTEGNYTRIFLSDHTYYLVRSSLSGALKRLPPEMFIKIHRSLVASIYFIDHIAKDHLIIGEVFRKRFKKRHSL